MKGAQYFMAANFHGLKFKAFYSTHYLLRSCASFLRKIAFCVQWT